MSKVVAHIPHKALTAIRWGRVTLAEEGSGERDGAKQQERPKQISGDEHRLARESVNPHAREIG